MIIIIITTTTPYYCCARHILSREQLYTYISALSCYIGFPQVDIASVCTCMNVCACVRVCLRTICQETRVVQTMTYGTRRGGRV